MAGAKAIGKLVAERAKEKGINTVVFDRGGYHVSRPRQGAGRCGARSGTGVLTDGSEWKRKADRPAAPEPEGTGGAINRVTKVVKGGKNLSFSALVVVGDPRRKVVGFGIGKAKEVPSAIQKGIEAAKKNLRKVQRARQPPFRITVLGRFGSGLVLLKPAPDGTGVIAGGPVRAVIQAVGIPNVLTKSIGSHNPHNVVKATINALEQLRDKSASRGYARPGAGEGVG